MPIAGGFLKRIFADRTLMVPRNEFSLPSDSSFTLNLDCAPVPIDTGQKKSLVIINNIITKIKDAFTIKPKHGEDNTDTIVSGRGRRKHHLRLRKNDSPSHD
jgi:hypothetical protein